MRELEIKSRLRKYLERDRKGIRRKLLMALLEGDKYTTEEIYKKLNTKDVNQRGVSAMVGLMCSRLGIIKTELGERNRYYIKPEYAEIVKSVLQEFER